MLTDSGLAGKAAIVTGGSRGIGRAIVELLAAEGADVTFLFRENTAAAARGGRDRQGRRAARSRPSRSTSATPQACAAAVERVAERCGRIDVLVNNAGVIRDNLLRIPRRRRRADGARHQCRRRVQRDARGGAAHDRPPRGQDHQPQLGGRREGRARPDQLRGEQGRDQRLHARAGGRAGAAQDHGERGGPGRHRDRDVARPCASSPATRSRRASCCGASAPRTEVAYAVWFLASRFADYITGQVLHVDGGFKME